MAARGAARSPTAAPGSAWSSRTPSPTASGCAMAVADAAPAGTTRSSGLQRGHAGGGGHCARTPADRARHPCASGAPSSRQHDPARRHRRERTDPARRHLPRIGLPDERITVPMATIFIDADEWDARASHSAAPATRCSRDWRPDVAQRMGRVGRGRRRYAGDAGQRARPTATPAPTRSRTSTSRSTPRHATTDLRGIRAAIKQALIHHQRRCPTNDWHCCRSFRCVPKRLVRRMVSVATGNATSVVSSNLGEVDRRPPPAGRHRRGLLHDASGLSTRG